MTPENVLSTIYQFRTHPFCPTMGVDGRPFPRDPFALPLDPLSDPRHVDYYYDLYEWSGSTQIGPLDSAQIFRRFPAPDDVLNLGSLLVILAGPEHSGRESLRNLLLHKIGRQTDEPLLINLGLEGGDRGQVVKQVAELFMLKYPMYFDKPTQGWLGKSFETITRTKVATQDSYYANLFQVWSEEVQKICKRPLVLSITGKPDYNTWRVLYNSTRALFSYFFVLTGDVASAQTCRDTLRGGNVAVIVAQPLSENQAIQYICSRLSNERPADIAPSLEPFSAAAISILYQRGPAATQDVRWQVAFLNRTMRRALDEHLRLLVATLQARGSLDRAKLSLQEIEIDADAVRHAREALNMGQ